MGCGRLRFGRRGDDTTHANQSESWDGMDWGAAGCDQKGEGTTRYTQISQSESSPSLKHPTDFVTNIAEGIITPFPY